MCTAHTWAAPVLSADCVLRSSCFTNSLFPTDLDNSKKAIDFIEASILRKFKLTAAASCDALQLTSSQVIASLHLRQRGNFGRAASSSPTVCTFHLNCLADNAGKGSRRHTTRTTQPFSAHVEELKVNCKLKMRHIPLFPLPVFSFIFFHFLLFSYSFFCSAERERDEQVIELVSLPFHFSPLSSPVPFNGTRWDPIDFDSVTTPHS